MEEKLKSQEECKNKSCLNDVLAFVVLFPLGIGIFSWFIIGASLLEAKVREMIIGFEPSNLLYTFILSFNPPPTDPMMLSFYDPSHSAVFITGTVFVFAFVGVVLGLVKMVIKFLFKTFKNIQ